MNEFINKYQSDEDFRGFIDAISDTTSDLWNEYKILKSYEILVSNETDIKEKKVDISYMIEPIDYMIEYFQKHEAYEKCSRLNTIKKYILN